MQFLRRMYPVRRAELFLEEAIRNHQLSRAVDQALVVFEVASEPHVAENGFLELVV